MEDRSHQEFHPHSSDKMEKLREELTTLHKIREYLQEQIRLEEHPNENGDPKAFKRALATIQTKINRLERKMRH